MAVVHLQIQELIIFFMSFFLTVFSLITVIQYIILTNLGYLYVACIYSNLNDDLNNYLLCF